MLDRSNSCRPLRPSVFHLCSLPCSSIPLPHFRFTWLTLASLKAIWRHTPSWKKPSQEFVSVPSLILQAYGGDEVGRRGLFNCCSPWSESPQPEANGQPQPGFTGLKPVSHSELKPSQIVFVSQMNLTVEHCHGVC